MNWSILGIGPTKDKRAITAAYREKLQSANPEEKPEAFMALRAAYEEALRLADQAPAEEAPADSPVELWMGKVRNLYRDYPARIDPQCWETILNDEVCDALELRGAAEKALLEFLMENPFLPQSVWQKLDGVFCFLERREELYEHYPREFIDYVVINGIRLPTLLPYELFEPGENSEDCDAYRRLYKEARQLPLQEIGPVLEQMDWLSESHPYGDALRFRAELTLGNRETGRQGLRQLAQAHPDDPVIAGMWADVCMDAGELDEAERYCTLVLASHPDDGGVMETYAQLLAAKGDYDQAKQHIFDLLDGTHDPYAMERLNGLIRQWNEAIIRQREEAFGLHPEDSENAVELAWCYLQNDELEKAQRVCGTLEPEQGDAYSVCNLLGKLWYSCGDYHRSLEYLQKLETILRTMPPDGTEKTAGRLRRLPEILQLEGACLTRLEAHAAAQEKMTEALALSPEDPKLQASMGRFLYARREYEGAAEFLQRAVRSDPEDWYAYVTLSLAQYRLHRDAEAFASIRQALRLQPYELESYVIQMQILLRNGAWDQVRSTLEYLQQQGAPEDASILWCRGQLAEFADENTEEALRLYRAAAEQVETGDNLIWASQLYYRIALLMARLPDAGNDKNGNARLAMLEKGLAHDAFDEDCLDYKGWLLKTSGRTQQALELFQALEKLPNHPLVVERNLAELYYAQVGSHAAEVLACYEKLLRVRPNGDYCYYAGYCKRLMGDYGGAEAYSRREIDLAPDDVDGYNGLAYALEAQGRKEEALAQIERALAVAEEQNQFFLFLHEHKIQILCRMNRWEDALKAVNAAMQGGEYAKGYQRQFDICIQFGKWDVAQKVLDRWCQEQGQTPQWKLAAGRLYLFRGQTELAEGIVEKAAPLLPLGDVQDFLRDKADLTGDTAQLLRIWSSQQQENPKSDYYLIHLAFAQLQSGQQKAAKATAQRALNLLDEILRGYSVNEPLYRTRRAMALALVGREEEARQELALARSLPLCEKCDYCSCKDADVFEAAIEELCGDRRKALELYRRGAERWPDELDFRAGEIRTRQEGE